MFESGHVSQKASVTEGKCHRRHESQKASVTEGKCHSRQVSQKASVIVGKYHSRQVSQWVSVRARDLWRSALFSSLKIPNLIPENPL